ncbi:MAG: gamma-glutamylcyclotransferase [Pseudooceanicola sp.]
MPIDPAAFRHHPGLKPLVTDPEQSFFREFLPARQDERARQMGRPATWRRTDSEREATRHAALEGRMDGEVWVFAYGSLMWDPALIFDEVRRATVTGHSRGMVLYDTGGARGSAEHPGLMAGLTEGGTCDGVAFRLPQGTVDRETEILWRREMIAWAYQPRFLPARTAHGDIEVLAFVADPEAPVIRTDLDRAETIRCIATGAGFLGTSFDYLNNMLTHFRELRIADPALESLMDEVMAYLSVRDGKQ